MEGHLGRGVLKRFDLARLIRQRRTKVVKKARVGRGELREVQKEFPLGQNKINGVTWKKGEKDIKIS